MILSLGNSWKVSWGNSCWRSASDAPLPATDTLQWFDNNVLITGTHRVAWPSPQSSTATKMCFCLLECKNDKGIEESYLLNILKGISKNHENIDDWACRSLFSKAKRWFTFRQAQRAMVVRDAFKSFKRISLLRKMLKVLWQRILHVAWRLNAIVKHHNRTWTRGTNRTL